jgi:hypothetical protein
MSGCLAYKRDGLAATPVSLLASAWAGPSVTLRCRRVAARAHPDHLKR